MLGEAENVGWGWGWGQGEVAGLENAGWAAKEEREGGGADTEVCGRWVVGKGGV